MINALRSHRRQALVAVIAAVVLVASTACAPDAPQPQGAAAAPVGSKVTPAGHQTTLGDLPLNTVASPDGKMLVAVNAGQGTQSVQVIDPATSKVTQTIDYQAPESVSNGIAFSPDGKKLYVSAGANDKIRTYDVAAGRLTETAPIALPTTDAEGDTINPYPAGLAITPDGRRLIVADRASDEVTAVNLATDRSQTVAVGHTPSSITISADGKKAWVTESGAKTVSTLDIDGGSLTKSGEITVGTHPNQAVIDKKANRLYVSDGDSDQVSVVDAAKDKVIRTISLEPYKNANVGTSPVGLALADDKLYVANAGNNDVAVVDAKKSKVDGLIPTGWYPTSVVPAGGKLFVTNAKGLGAGPNTRTMPGTLSTIGQFGHDQLVTWTDQVYVDDGFDNHGEVRGLRTPVVPQRPGQATPIKHVIYVVKENRTYDQVLGSIGKGNGDPALNLFGDDSAPNQRMLARQYVTLDNFYADANVSADGWDASTQDTRIWDRLTEAHKTFRNYGFYSGAEDRVVDGNDPKLEASTDQDYRGFDLDCPDSARDLAKHAKCGQPRIDEWTKEFDGYSKSGQLPSMEMVRLPNDHTSGTKTGYPTPKAYVADNDAALGKLVDKVSHSKFWAGTAIFVVENNAQDGPDHVDAHRTVAQVISPYTRTGKVDSTFYSTASMLRTMELIVGLKPMTQVDAYSTPMSAAFDRRPDYEPYQAIKPRYPTSAVNDAHAPMAQQSAAQDPSGRQQGSGTSFNEAVWKSVNGTASKMPAPLHRMHMSASSGQ